MTPKEKAQQLIYAFEAFTDEENKFEFAKQCALIAVDEILDDDVYDMSEELFEKRIEYWEKVKQEITRREKRTRVCIKCCR